MRITQEADYALRIVSQLAITHTVCGAAELAETTGVPARFAHKILRKLLQAGIVRSYTGAKGGYTLLRPADELTMREVIEEIDGPIEITKCADEHYVCSKNGACKASCIYHRVFRALARDVAEKMGRLTIAELNAPGKSIDDILSVIS